MAVKPSALGQILQRAAGMVLAFCGHVGGVCGFLRGEGTKVQFLPVNLDTRTPRQDGFWLKGYAEDARGLVRRWGAASILRVDLDRGLAKILPAIVRAVAVDVVRLLFGERPGHVKKNETVCDVQFFGNADADVSVRVDAASNVTGLFTPAMNAPEKQSSGRFVAKNSPQIVSGNIGLGHSAFYIVGAMKWR